MKLDSNVFRISITYSGYNNPVVHALLADWSRYAEQLPQAEYEDSDKAVTLDSFFEQKKHATTVRVESIAGLTTFLAMAYITVVNPSNLADAGMDFGAVFVALSLIHAIGIVYGVYSG